MTPISVTITGGYGSERHNTDSVFREKLPHVDAAEGDIIALFPYVPYRVRINRLARPYVEACNERIHIRYEQAVEKYERGERKKKPYLSQYKTLGYDYYADHVGDMKHNRANGKVESVPMYRSLIVIIGDRDDRMSGRIPKDVAIEIFRRLLAEFQRNFPVFWLLSATVHIGEYGDASKSAPGAWHLHIDYKPLFPLGEQAQGLRMGIGFDGAMKYMGYEAEESIVVDHHRPLLFNAFRNRMFRALEKILPEYGLRLQLGVTSQKDPNKNPSQNLPLEAWQARMAETQNLQNVKNHWLDILLHDEVSPDGVKAALAAIAEAQQSAESLKKAPKTLTGTSYKLSEKQYDHLMGTLEGVMTYFAHILRKIDDLEEQAAQVEDLEEEVERLRVNSDSSKAEVSELRGELFGLRMK